MTIKAPAFGIALLITCLTAPLAWSQTTDAEVYSIVETFFDALASRDSTVMAGIFLEKGHAHAIVPNDSTTVVRTTSHEQTLASMASWNAGMVERMWSPTILINENLAVVWGPYDFYVSGKLSHCGTDTFTLIKTGDGWKISSIDYTVEHGTCELHPDGPPQ